MFSRHNLIALKTSLLGVLIIVASIGYVFYNESANPWIFGMLLIIGIAFLFLPDTLIESIKKLLDNNSKKQF